MREVAAVCLEEGVDLLALVGQVVVVDVDGVDEQDDFDWGLWVIDGFEAGDGLGRLVVEQGEVLLLQSGDGLAGFGCDDDVEGDPVGVGLGGRVLAAGVLSGLLGVGCDGAEHNAEQCGGETNSSWHGVPVRGVCATAR